MPQNFKNILIIKPSSLGDIVLALPALSALRRGFPDAKISWLIRSDYAPLLKNHPHLDEVILFDRVLFGRAWCDLKALKALIAFLRDIRRRQFDVVFDFQGLFRTAALAWLTGSEKRFGLANAREFASIFYTHKVIHDLSCIHLVDFYLKMVQSAGINIAEPEFVLPVDPAAKNTVDRLLASYNISPKKYAVLIPGSVHSEKCWPIERFAVIAEKISSRFGLSIVATGSSSEINIAEKLVQLSNVKIFNLAGKTNLNELIALLKYARIVVSNDTGPGHIAAALDTPTVIIFGRANPARLAPYKKPHSVAAVDPFGRGNKINDFSPKYDVKNITVDAVFEKVCANLTV
jgi:lipopolysaccharide heptosyltransferase I